MIDPAETDATDENAPTYERLLHEATEALSGMRASVRWDERSHMPMTDEWLARTVIDRIWPLIGRDDTVLNLNTERTNNDV